MRSHHWYCLVPSRRTWRRWRRTLHAAKAHAWPHIHTWETAQGRTHSCDATICLAVVIGFEWWLPHQELICQYTETPQVNLGQEETKQPLLDPTRIHWAPGHKHRYMCSSSYWSDSEHIPCHRGLHLLSSQVAGSQVCHTSLFAWQRKMKTTQIKILQPGCTGVRATRKPNGFYEKGLHRAMRMSVTMPHNQKGPWQ